MNIKIITDNLLCSGCGTCNAICGQEAISMKKTATMGLLHAVVDFSKCTDCGLCLKMCPSANALEEKNTVSEEIIKGHSECCYVGRSLNAEYYANAQSGGMVTTILAYLFQHQLIDAAVSCRMEYGLPYPNIHYSILTSADELIKNQHSCYTQVDIVSALSKTSQYKSVAIVGIPCQIQGVSNLLKLKKFSNITYRIGLICDKSYSDLYICAISKDIKLPSGKLKIFYRQKDFIHNGRYYNYRDAPTVFANENGEMSIIPKLKRVFLKDFFTVPKCKICWDKLNVHADIVLGDPWGLRGKYDEQHGDSVIIVRTGKAAKIVADMIANKLVKVNQVEMEEVAKGQHVELRLNNIKDVDWESNKQKWQLMEQIGKEKLMNQIALSYKRIALKNKIRKIIDFVILRHE